MNRPLFILFALLVLGFAKASAETFRTVEGAILDGRAIGVWGNELFVRAGKETASLSVDRLDDASLQKVARLFEARGAPRDNWKASQSKMAKPILKHLEILADGKFVRFDPGVRPEPEFYLVYFGALWCGPCRQFSPSLVATYHRVKEVAGDRFEVIFVSSDRSPKEQLNYAREANMPWPVLDFSVTDQVSVIEQWRADGIPCLVVLNRDGDLLFHSYRGDEYLGPMDALGKFCQLIQDTTPSLSRLPPTSGHRLAVARHRLAAAGGSRPPAPFCVKVDRRQLATLAVSRVVAHLQLDEAGHVTDAEFTPKLNAVLKDQFEHLAQDWLFLPALANGIPIKSSIELPIEF